MANLTQIERIVRRGEKNTRVIMGGKSVLLTNEALAALESAPAIPVHHLDGMNPIPGEVLYTFGLNHRCDPVVCKLTYVGKKDGKHVVKEPGCPPSFTEGNEYFRDCYSAKLAMEVHNAVNV